MSFLSFLMAQPVRVETFTGNNPRGPVYNAPVTVLGMLDDSLVQVKEPGGAEVVAKTTFYTELANAALFTDGSRVTANNVVHTVTTSRRCEGSPIFAVVEHLEVDLT